MNEIKFLREISSYFTGIKFIRHRNLIERKINELEESIRKEEIRENMYDF